MATDQLHCTPTPLFILYVWMFLFMHVIIEFFHKRALQYKKSYGEFLETLRQPFDSSDQTDAQTYIDYYQTL